jgi:TetR/AcrR family transcriptional regulator
MRNTRLFSGALRATGTKGDNSMLTAFGKLSFEVQERILDAAAAAFAQEGYHYAGIAEICSRAGISNGALYKYFRNKDDLFFAVLDSSIDLVEEIYKKNFTARGTVFDIIHSLLHDLAAFSESHPDHTRIYCDLGSCSMNRFAGAAQDKYKNSTSIYTIQLISEAKLRGEISPRIDSKIAAYMIDSYITFFSYSLVSEYQQRRFISFFMPEGLQLDVDAMIELTVISLKQALT